MQSVRTSVYAPSQPTRGVQIGNYSLLRELGQGGYAHVYLAEHLFFKTRVALKLLKHSGAGHEEIRQFQFEAHLLTHLRHRHIVRALEFGWKDGTPFLAMEYAPKGTLQMSFLQEVPRPLSSILPAVLQTARALQYLHNHQVIHCDVKPENLLLGPHNEIWLADFGIATTVPPTLGRRYNGREVKGTARYMAPERIQGDSLPASDQYALAVMVYEWLCGQPPFDGSALGICAQHVSTPPPRLREHVPSISAAVERVVLKALKKDPHKRYAHVLEFVSALKQANLSGVDRLNLVGAAGVGSCRAVSPHHCLCSNPVHPVESRYVYAPVNTTLDRSVQTVKV